VLTVRRCIDSVGILYCLPIPVFSAVFPVKAASFPESGDEAEVRCIVYIYIYIYIYAVLFLRKHR
jgi:hypothetical protein